MVANNNWYTFCACAVSLHTAKDTAAARAREQSYNLISCTQEVVGCVRPASNPPRAHALTFSLASVNYRYCCRCSSNVSARRLLDSTACTSRLSSSDLEFDTAFRSKSAASCELPTPVRSKSPDQPAAFTPYASAFLRKLRSARLVRQHRTQLRHGWCVFGALNLQERNLVVLTRGLGLDGRVVEPCTKAP